MTTQVNEFAINLPMIAAQAVGQTAQSNVPAIDCTPVSLPPEVDSSSCNHIYVYVDGCPQVNQVEGSSMIHMDLVMNVSVSNPVTGTSSSYKIVKRLSMDKCKLAVEAETMTPYQVVEGEAEPEDEALVEAEMSAFYHKRDVMRKAGIQESAGTETAKVLISYNDDSAAQKAVGTPARATATLTIKNVKDKAHARHVFKTKHAASYTEPKITRVTMVKGDK